MEYYLARERRGGMEEQSFRFGHHNNNNPYQEAMWRSRFPSSSEGAGFYPERPGGEQDCPYYMRTGLCGFGMNCRFNHPPDRRLLRPIQREDLPERIGQPECQYYLKTGTCKFGSTCKYHHPQDKAGMKGRTQLNVLSLPLRPGEKECAYYMKTGQCKYGPTCKFNHPQPTVLPVAAYQGGGSNSTPLQQYPAWQSPRPYLPSPRMQAPAGYTPIIYPPPEGVVSMPRWNPYQGGSAMLGPEAQQRGLGAGYVIGSTLHDTMSMSMPTFPAQSPRGGTVFPERPGELECEYYMKTGDCKFGMSCRFHHPRDRSVPSPNCLLSPLGLPVRPGATSCAFYLKQGYCKFGSLCKFDHPFITVPSYSPLTSPMSEIQASTYNATLGRSPPYGPTLSQGPGFGSKPSHLHSPPGESAEAPSEALHLSDH